MLATLPELIDTDFPDIQRGSLQILQVNLGYLCNQQCLHCHVNAGPNRREVMAYDTIQHVIEFLDKSGVRCLDLTGGAPELNPYFRELVCAARSRDIRVIDRCNLTVLKQPGQHDLGEFLAEHQIEVVASLPCYLEENVEQQRGRGVFADSLAGLRHLNSLGYGKVNSGLQLNLMFNPNGPVLPPPQQALEADYKKRLGEYDVEFNQLFTLVNMPIQRFGGTLLAKGQFKPYMQLLREAYCSDNLNSLMCRTLLSIDWQGYIYDCDFNQMLGLHLRIDKQSHLRLANLADTDLTGNPIITADHCYGCTAGQGSSCGGSLS